MLWGIYILVVAKTIAEQKMGEKKEKEGKKMPSLLIHSLTAKI
jgi:hypothetical protein